MYGVELERPKVERLAQRAVAQNVTNFSAVGGGGGEEEAAMDAVPVRADVVVLAHAWTALEDPVAHLQRCLRKLKPGGKVSIMCVQHIGLPFNMTG